MEHEERRLTIAELRTTVDIDRRPIIEGHAAVFNQPSLEIFRDAPGWREIIRPGAFRDAIKTDDVVALYNHDNSKLIGRRSSGTLALEEDEIGLKVRIFPPNTATGDEVLELIRRKDLKEMSFGFSLPSDGSGETRNHGNKMREILKVQMLYDVSPVTQAAYKQTDVGLRVDPNFRSRIETDLTVQPEVERQLTIKKETLIFCLYDGDNKIGAYDTMDEAEAAKAAKEQMGMVMHSFLPESKARSEARRKIISTYDLNKRRFVYVCQR